MDIAWFQSRYDKAGPGGERRRLHQLPARRATNTRLSSTRCWPAKRPSSRNSRGTPYFDGCLPIEVMAERGRETLRHGPMKPVGLTNPHKPTIKPYAVVQLRQDNALGTLFNMVGFQTKLKHGAQARSLPHHPRAGERRIRAARRPAPQHLPQLAQACSTRACG